MSLACLLLPAILRAAGIVQNGGFEIGELDPGFKRTISRPAWGKIGTSP